ncbi:MAG: hypothetical protein K8J08_22155, partial [Thermoanaerobaculia bacterium]|nr:hypothetical protein [Thermoanaerobaculia bacterium]
VEIEQYGLPQTYWDQRATDVAGLSLEDVTEQADAVLQPDHLVWVVVGDRALIEDKIRALDLGEIHLIDANGNPVSN